MEGAGLWRSVHVVDGAGGTGPRADIAELVGREAVRGREEEAVRDDPRVRLVEDAQLAGAQSCTYVREQAEVRPVKGRRKRRSRSKLCELEHAEARQRETVHDDGGDVRLGDITQLRGCTSV